MPTFIMMRKRFLHRSRKPRFPRRPGNRLDLLVDGQNFIPAMLQTIADARQYILVEMYLFESGKLTTHFINALLQAVNRGVIVRLLIDDFGSLGLHARDRLRLINGGITLVYFNPLRFSRPSSYLHRDHRKLLLVDGRIAFTGGSGITDSFDPTLQPHGWWHDLMLRMEGPIVLDWQSLFERTWQNTGGEARRLPKPPSSLKGPFRVRLTENDGRRPDIQRRLVRRIKKAKNRIYISVAYFVPPLAIRAALRQAAKRGVEVRLILPGHHTDHQSARYAGHRFYSQLLRAGVCIHEFLPRFTHVKLMICDNWVSLGSANLDHWTLRWNLEANLEIEEPEFVAVALGVFQKDLEETKEITFDAWRARNRLTRSKEWFWSVISGWLARRRPPH